MPRSKSYPHWRMLFWIAVRTGMRRGEIFGLDRLGTSTPWTDRFTVRSSGPGFDASGSTTCGTASRASS